MGNDLVLSANVTDDTNVADCALWYKLDNGNFPTTEQGLAALRVKPADATQWNGPYMPQEIPKDPWGHDWVYKFPGDHGDETEPNDPVTISFDPPPVEFASWHSLWPLVLSVR